MYAYQRLPEVSQYLYRPPSTRLDCLQRIEGLSSRPFRFDEDGDTLILAVVLNQTHGVIGKLVLKLSAANA